MKVALLAPTFSRFSGIDRVVEQQARDMVREGNSVTIFTLEADMDPPENVQLQIVGMPRSLFWQRVYRLIFPVDIIKALKWVPRLKHYDIIYAHQYPMTWLAYLAKRLYYVKYVYYDHGLTPPETFPSFVERTYWRLLILIANWTVSKANSALSVSGYLQKQCKIAPGVDSEVAYNSIDTQRFCPAIDGLTVRRKYRLEDAPVVLYVGRISPHKGVHLLLEAFGLVIQEISDAKLLIVGKHTFPGYSDRLKKMSNDLVIFIGDVPDEELPLYYAACDVYATAALWEGFNLPLVEAQACGKPVIAFNLGPHPEVIQDGITGFLVPPEDTAAMADAMIKLLENDELKKEMGAKACKWVSGKFGLKNIKI